MKRLLSLWVLVAAVAALALWQARRWATVPWYYRAAVEAARSDDGWALGV